MFFDNASTTKIDEEIILKLSQINDEFFYNPGGLYKSGRRVKEFIKKCREDILNALNCDGGNIVFCGSATECNNLAIMGSVKKNTKKILVSMGEHPSVYNVALELKNRGFDVQFVPLQKSGIIDYNAFEQMMTKDVDIVSIMHVSNETGAINDIVRLVEYSKSVNPKVIFHCDGVQAFGKIGVDIELLGVDMYTISAHKIHGCKGVGALYVSPKTTLKPIIFGGGQEGGLRSGTENILGIFTLSEACKMAVSNLDKYYKHVKELKNYFLKKLSETGLKFSLHSFDENSPYIVSISFLGCRAETILNMLDDIGVMVGNGSACSSKNSGNRILESMCVPKEEVISNIRISFNKYHTKEDIDCLAEKLKKVVGEYLLKI